MASRRSSTPPDSSRRSGCANGHRSELPDRRNRKHDKKHENADLHDQEWRLGLRRSDRLEARPLLKGLDDSHKDIEIERNHSGDDIDPTPRAAELKGVACEDCHSQNYKRNHADI